MEWTKNELLALFPSHRGEVNSIRGIHEVFIDSRKKVKNGLFVPIVGERFDGHQFLHQAIENGAVAALWQTDKEKPKDVPADFPVFLVNDTVTGLQQVAKSYLRSVDPVVVAVTGSNGKTTTKDMIESVLRKKFRTHKTQGNLNNHIGLPLTILDMEADCEAAVLEMGMNHFGEISVLSKLAEPDFAVITNIGESHIEFLGSREGIATAKMEILDGLKPGGKVIYDGDEPLLDKLKKVASVACGFDQGNDFVITDVQHLDTGVQFSLNEGDTQYKIPVLGEHNVKNATFAIAAASELGLSTEEIREALMELTLTKMRFEQVHGQNGAMLINDAYNASPTSMKVSIQAVRALNDYKRKVLVLADMYELGENEKAYHESVAEDIIPPITDVVTIGPRARWIAEKVEGSIEVTAFESKEEAIVKIKDLLAPDTVVLFKGSHAMALETIVERLMK
ncbi:MAG TPA: UDP-N-acetylmuramoyl-tripeptide--D-alanyl-D-alanine ligase [Bacillales bacterium]|nr:UDP-N-acetylmuramoyl-tripeptide--D-alanyl-D-alanine ligase [Bacillales bacterium]